MEGLHEKLPSTATDVEDAIKDILQSNPEFGVKSVLKEMHLKGLEIGTKEARSIVSRLKADIKDKEVHSTMSRSEADTQDKKFHSILFRSTADIQDKGIHNIVSNSKADIQEESPEQQICVANETSGAVSQYLDDVLCTMLKTPKEVVRNFQALTHVFNGFMGSYELNLACISRLIAQNPFYQRGDTTNTPLESCKLVTTLVMLLCSELSIKKIKTITSFLTRSSGGLDNLGSLPPNQGVLEAAVESAKKDMLRDRKCRALAASMTDLYTRTIA
ncbi:hypothetical protein BGZ79_003473 [Entomortierella chlamydospora]|nr:hypothetical protein BGZ79_003473 [Entomortierella chlamydospora]